MPTPDVYRSPTLGHFCFQVDVTLALEGHGDIVVERQTWCRTMLLPIDWVYALCTRTPGQDPGAFAVDVPHLCGSWGPIEPVNDVFRVQNSRGVYLTAGSEGFAQWKEEVSTLGWALSEVHPATMSPGATVLSHYHSTQARVAAGRCGAPQDADSQNELIRYLLAYAPGEELGRAELRTLQARLSEATYAFFRNPHNSERYRAAAVEVARVKASLESSPVYQAFVEANPDV